MLEFDLNYFGLQDLITFLEDFEDCTLKVGFSAPHSFRGYYEDLAFEPIKADQPVKEALEIIRPCLREVFQGYKGGDYTMNEYTTCWFAEYGLSGGQQISHMLMTLLIINP